MKTIFFQMIAIKERLVELDQQYKEMSDSKQTRDITQEFVFRSKLRDLHNVCKVYRQKFLLCCRYTFKKKSRSILLCILI